MNDSTWDAVLGALDEVPEDGYVCFSKLPTHGGERVLIAREDDWGVDDDDVPAPAAAEGMTSCFDRGQLMGIVSNARQQDPGVSDEVLRQAVRYYFTNDAFLTIDGSA